MANAQALIEKEKREKTGYLDLGRCGLTVWPDLRGMVWLETLIISNRWWDLEQSRWIDSINQGEPNLLITPPELPLPLGIKNIISGGEDPWDGSLKINDFSFLNGLPKLSSLNISYNNINDASFLASFIGLTSLNIRGNQISDVSFIKKMTRLTSLDISDNRISDLSPVLNLVEKGIPVVWDEFRPNAINVLGNPFTMPPVEVVQHGNSAIIEYFHQKQAVGINLLPEAKLILLGDGRSGKTSLANRLLGKELPKEEDRTQGVDIVIGEYGFPLSEGKNFKLNIWDFAGQDKYKPLHQFFYTESSVYVLVAPSGSAATDFDDWLQTAELFGEGSPLIILLNEFKDGIGFGSFDVEAWKRRFPNLLKEVYCVNLGTLRGFDELEKHLQFLAQTLPHTKYEFPANWSAIRRELEGRRDSNYISLADYLVICKENNLPEEKSALILSSVLHKIGACLHYQGNPLLEGWIILKNEWATTAVYKILEDVMVAEHQKGFFDKADMERIWSEQEYRNMRPQLLELMCQFRMAYPLPNNKGYITPPLLPAAPPNHWKWKESEHIELHLKYEFMPKALLTQFIVSRYLEIDEGRTLVWRNGVVLRWEGAVAKVEKTKSQGLDAMIVRCQGRDKKALMTSILKTFRDLHEEYKGIKVSENVPCNCSSCLDKANKQHFFKLEDLKKRVEKGKNTIDCAESVEEVNIMELLGEVLVMKKSGDGRGLEIDPDTQRPLTKAEIKELIAGGKIEDALKALRYALPSEEKTIIQLQFNLSEVSIKGDKGIIYHENKRVDLGQIVDAALKLADRLT